MSPLKQQESKLSFAVVEVDNESTLSGMCPS